MKRRGISEDDLYLNLVKSREWLRQWREEHPKARMVKIDGNHEERFVKYVCSKAPILRDFVKQPKEVLQLNALKIKHQPTGSVIKIGKLLYAHGDQFMGGWGAVNPAKTVFDRTRESMLVGHVHKFSTWRHRGATGVQRGVWTNGCLCDIQEYDLHPQWQWGATLVKYVPSGNFRVHPMEIVNGELVYSTKWVATS